MFSAVWRPQARAQYDALRNRAFKCYEGRRKAGKTKSTKQEGLFRQVRKALRLLYQNPRHPSLNTHPYSSIPNPDDKNQKVFEAYAQSKTPAAYRIFWCYGPKKKEITIIAITPHP